MNRHLTTAALAAATVSLAACASSAPDLTGVRSDVQPTTSTTVPMEFPFILTTSDGGSHPHDCPDPGDGFITDEFGLSDPSTAYFTVELDNIGDADCTTNAWPQRMTAYFASAVWTEGAIPATFGYDDNATVAAYLIPLSTVQMRDRTIAAGEAITVEWSGDTGIDNALAAWIGDVIWTGDPDVDQINLNDPAVYAWYLTTDH